MDIIRQYNKWQGQDKTLIAKALTSAAGSGGALIPYNVGGFSE